jgi:hypothetical protein
MNEKKQVERQNSLADSVKEGYFNCMQRLYGRGEARQGVA